MSAKPKSIRLVGALSLAAAVASVLVAVRFARPPLSPWVVLGVGWLAGAGAALGFAWVVVSWIMFAIRGAARSRGLLPTQNGARPGAAGFPFGGIDSLIRARAGSDRAGAIGAAGVVCGVCNAAPAAFACDSHWLPLCSACVSVHIVAQAGGDPCRVLARNGTDPAARAPAAPRGTP